MKATQQQEKEFIALVEEYKQVIYKVCYVYATDADHLNDLYQEVVINLWKAYPRFRGDCKSSTWVYRIGLNTCISFFRQLERALILLWLEERSYQEIAEIIGISKNNVAVKLNRIREKLKAMSNS